MSWATLPPLSRASNRPPLGAGVAARKVLRRSPLGRWTPTPDPPRQPPPALGFRRPPLKVPQDTLTSPRRPRRRLPNLAPASVEGPQGERPAVASPQSAAAPQTPAIQAQPQSATVAPETPTAPTDSRQRSPQVPADRSDLPLPTPPLAARHQQPLGNFQIPATPAKLQRSAMPPAVTPPRPPTPAPTVAPTSPDNGADDRPPRPTDSAPPPPTPPARSQLENISPPDAAPPPLQGRSQPPATPRPQTPPTPAAPLRVRRPTEAAPLESATQPPLPADITPSPPAQEPPLQLREAPTEASTMAGPDPSSTLTPASPPIQRQADPLNLTESSPAALPAREATETPLPPLGSLPPTQRRETPAASETPPPLARREAADIAPERADLRLRPEINASESPRITVAVAPPTPVSPSTDSPAAPPIPSATELPAAETTPAIAPTAPEIPSRPTPVPPAAAVDSPESLRRSPQPPTVTPAAPTPAEPELAPPPSPTPVDSRIAPPERLPSLPEAPAEELPSPIQARSETPARPLPEPPPPPPTPVDLSDRATPSAPPIPQPAETVQRSPATARPAAAPTTPSEPLTTPTPDTAVMRSHEAQTESPLNPAPSPPPSSGEIPKAIPIQRSLETAEPAISRSPLTAPDPPQVARSPAAPVPPVQLQPQAAPTAPTPKAPLKEPLGWKFLRPLAPPPSPQDTGIATHPTEPPQQRSSRLPAPPEATTPPAIARKPSQPTSAEPWEQQFQLRTRAESPPAEPWQAQFNLEPPRAPENPTPNQAPATSSSPAFTLTSPLVQTRAAPQPGDEAVPPPTTHTLTSEATTTAAPGGEKLTEAQIEQLARICYGQLRSQLSQGREYYLGRAADLLPWFDVIAYLPIEKAPQADNAPAKADQEVSLIELQLEPKIQAFLEEVNALVKDRLRADQERLPSPYGRR